MLFLLTGLIDELIGMYGAMIIPLVAQTRIYLTLVGIRGYLSMENPFIITGKIKPEYFCDRDVEAEKIIRKVTSGENIVLMAARRVGKSM